MSTGCECFCAVNHPDQRRVCTGKREAVLVLYVQTVKEIINVPVCMACREATLDQ